MKLKENRRNISEFTEDLKEISDKINRIVTKIEKGEGFLGKIIHDEKMYEDIQSGVSLFSEMGKTVTKTVFYIGMRGEVYKDWDGKGIFTVRVQPDDKKYYLVEIVGDSRGRVGQGICGRTFQQSAYCQKTVCSRNNPPVCENLRDGYLRKEGSVNRRRDEP